MEVGKREQDHMGAFLSFVLCGKNQNQIKKRGEIANAYFWIEVNSGNILSCGISFRRLGHDQSIPLYTMHPRSGGP